MADSGTIHTSINQLDLIVLSVLGLSGLLSFFRGFVREVLSLGAWLGASVITLYAFPRVTAMIEPHVHNKGIAGGMAALGVFLAALIGLTIFTGILVKFLKPGKEIGVLDNLTGLGFGVARGALLLAVAYYAMALVLKPSDYPGWVKHSVSAPYIEKLSHFVAHLAPDYLGAPEPETSLAKNTNNTESNDDDADEESSEKKTGFTLPTLKELEQRMQQENKQ